MSEESPPPPLRLRPRARTDEAASTPSVAPAKPPAEPAPPPSFSSAPAEPELSMRLRLKPKLMVEAEPKTVAPIPSNEPVSAPEKVESAAVHFSQEPAPDANEIPRLKLKSLQASANPVEITPEVLAFPPPLPDIDEAMPVPPPLPPPLLTEADDAPHPSAPLLKPLTVIKSDDQVDSVILAETLIAPLGKPFKPPARASRLSTGRVVIAFAVLLIVAGGIYYAYSAFSSAPAAAPAVVVRIAPVPPPVAVPAVAQAPVVPQKTVAQVPSSPMVEQKQSEPVTLVKPAAPVRVAPKPSTEFLVWVESVKISGVFNGSPPRAIVNGLLVRPGDTIDSVRGVVFDHLDVSEKQFFFRDHSGAVTSKSY